MNLPTYEELYPYTLQSLSDGLPKAIKEIREEVANDLKLTQEQINFLSFLSFLMHYGKSTHSPPTPSMCCFSASAALLSQNVCLII